MKKALFLVSILLAIGAAAWAISRKSSNYTTSPTPLVTAIPSNSREIQIYLPTKDTKTVGTKFIIYGKGRGFENTLNYRISDGGGKQLHLGSFMTNAPDAGIFGYFDLEIDLSKILKTIPSAIRLDVYEASAKDGSDIHKTSFDLNIDQSKTAVFTYFTNNNLDPDNTCQKVFALPRLAPKTQSVLKVAIEEVLKGLTADESNLTFFNSINPGVKLNSVKIENSTAYIDFNGSLVSGGSCAVMAVREQITATAKQFLNVRNVVISIRGETEGILEP